MCTHRHNAIDVQNLQCKMNKTKMVTIYSSPLHYGIGSPNATEASSF